MKSQVGIEMFSRLAFDALCHYNDNHMIICSISPIFEEEIEFCWDNEFWMSKLKTKTSSSDQIRVSMCLDNGINNIGMLIKSNKGDSFWAQCRN